MNITRKDLPKARTQAQSQFNNEFLKVFRQCKRKPSDITVLKETLKAAHKLCGEFEKDQELKAIELGKKLEAQAEAKADAEKVDEQNAEDEGTGEDSQGQDETSTTNKDETKAGEDK